MKCKIERIETTKARSYLDRNQANRKIRPARIDRYANDMINGYWIDNGASIVFDTNGDLRDGQHRLMALVKAEATHDFVVVTDVPVEAFQTMDECSPRTIADMLDIEGHENASLLSAAVTRIYMMQKYGLHIGRNETRRHPTLTNGEAHDFVIENPEIKRTVEIIGALKMKKGFIPRGVLAALHWKCAGINKKDADYFFTHLATGASLEDDSPIYVLRERLIESSVSGLSEKRLHERNKAAMVVKAWNLYRRGEPATKIKLSWRRRGRAKEGFPTPI